MRVYVCVELRDLSAESKMCEKHFLFFLGQIKLKLLLANQIKKACLLIMDLH